MDKLNTILNAIRKRAGIAMMYKGNYIFNTTQARFEDVKELLDILNIQYDEDWDCCITALHFTIDDKQIKVSYTHDFEW